MADADVLEAELAQHGKISNVSSLNFRSEAILLRYFDDSFHTEQDASLHIVFILSTICNFFRPLDTGDEVNSTTIELKRKIQKMLHTPAMRSLLNKLEVKGEPVWGLSVDERELVKAAKSKYLS